MRRLILGFFILTAVAAPALAQTKPPAGTTTASAQSTEYVRTFFLTHAPVAEVQQILVQLTARTPGTRPVVTVSPTNNALTIRGTEAQLREFEEVIKQLDVPPSSQTPKPEAPRAQGGSGQGGTTPAPVAQQNRLPALAMLPSTTNVQLELTITDTISGSPVTKTVSMVILNGSSGMIRTATPGQDHMLNVDAVANAYQNGMIGVRLSFEFQPASETTEGKPGPRRPRLNESLTVVVVDGKPLVVSQSADAASDRTVTASIKATVLK
jgi:hypothetical protein